MNISLTKELERLVKQKVQSGQYASDSEVIRDAIRKAFCSSFDPDKDSPELAEMIRNAQKGAYAPYRREDLEKSVNRVLATRKKRG
jgi:Arc/MetJ-type ribon-helix-helix transcriptional regulator